MSFFSMKEILSAIISDGTCSSVEPQTLPLPQIIPEEKMKKVLALILTGAQVNSSLRGDIGLEWYIKTFCETSLSNCLSKNVRQVCTLYNRVGNSVFSFYTLPVS